MSRQKSTTSVISTQLSFLDIPTEDKRPLPELIALGGSDWAAFPLACADVDSTQYYAVQDWIRGVTLSDNPRKVWLDLKSRYNPDNISDVPRKDKRGRKPITKEAAQRVQDQLCVLVTQLPYTATDGKNYKMDHATAEGLYLITQLMESESGIRNHILAYLAKAGVTLDEIRTEQRSIATLKGAAKTLESALSAYDDQGKGKAWQAARAVGIIDRNTFVKALTDHVFDLDAKYHFADATNTVYKGLWKRNAGELREEMSLKKSDDLRDHQTTWALHYQGLVESTVAHYLDKETTVSYYAAKRIIEDVASVFGVQADQLSKRLGFDLATGRPLIGKGK